MEELVQRFRGYVSRVYDDSMVLRLWDDAEPTAEIRREFDKELLQERGIKDLGQPVEFSIVSIDGKPKIDIRAIGTPGGPISMKREIDQESLREFND
jgi:hypothetical protein